MVVRVGNLTDCRAWRLVDRRGLQFDWVDRRHLVPFLVSAAFRPDGGDGHRREDQVFDRTSSRSESQTSP